MLKCYCLSTFSFQPPLLNVHTRIICTLLCTFRYGYSKWQGAQIAWLCSKSLWTHHLLDELCLCSSPALQGQWSSSTWSTAGPTTEVLTWLITSVNSQVSIITSSVGCHSNSKTVTSVVNSCTMWTVLCGTLCVSTVLFGLVIQTRYLLLVIRCHRVTSSRQEHSKSCTRLKPNYRTTRGLEREWCECTQPI